MIFYGLMPFSAWLLPLFAALGIGIGILKQNRFVATLYASLLCFWWILQGISCGLGPHLTFHIVAVGLICVAVSSLRPRGISEAALGRIGVLLIFGGLTAPSFIHYWGGLLYANIWNDPRINHHHVAHLFWTFALPVINFAILPMIFCIGNRRINLWDTIRHNKVVTATAISIFVLWIGSYSVSLYTNPSGGRYYYHYNSYNLFLNNPLALGGMFAVNALIVVLTVWMILVGLKRERGDWFWSGVLFFLFWAIVRYVDLFSGIGGMLGAAAIFMFCGLFMLGVVYFWTTRPSRHSREEEPQEELRTEFVAPPWMTAIQDKILLFWQSERNVLTAVIIVAVLQFGVLGAMIANEMRPHVSGATIRVATVPVDPRDLFRGDYVILRYEFSSTRSIPGFHGNHASEQTVYAVMRQEGELWKATSLHRTRPKEGVFLRGVVKPYSNEIVYGIESYFVQEGTGKVIEDAMRSNRESVVVELAVAPNGKTSIKTVHVNP